jgi:hypothetical protein
MQEEVSKFAAFSGIDWADRKHDICLQVAGTDTCELSSTMMTAMAFRTRANESQ